MFLLIPMGLIVLAGIIYLAISKKSSFTVRIASLIALGLMIAAVIVCLFIVFGMSAAPKGPWLPDAPSPETPPQAGSSSVAMIFFIVFLIALLLVVILVSMREHRRAEKARAEE
jgi:FtsH-binding integral membrane protein